MSRSTSIAIALGLLAGAACKKSNEGAPSAKQQDPAATATATASATSTTPAAASTSTGAGVTAGGIERAPDEGSAAMIASATGTVEVRRLGETTWTAAKADTKLYAGDVVRTQDGSSATLMLADQSTVEVAETSTVAVASRDGSADPASSAAVLSGLARFTVTSRTAGEGAFRVYTPSAVVLTKGTTYGIGVAASGETRVGVESGEVDVVALTSLDAAPVEVASSTQVSVSAEGTLGAPSAWATDDWGTWRNDADTKAEITASVDAHGKAMTALDASLTAGYADLQATADSAATFETTAATAAEKNDPAAYGAVQLEGATTIDASFALAGRLEALTWAHAAHATLATDVYTRYPADTKAQWQVVAPQVDASVLWPKRFEVTATAYWQPLRTQYYVHHDRGRMHAPLVGITVPQFFASVEAKPVEPTMVRAKIKGGVWATPSLAYQPSTRPVWVTMPAADWSSTAKVTVAPPRAKVGWYARPATLKAKAMIGAPVAATWQSNLTVAAPQPRAAIAASWKIPVGTKIRVDAPDMAAAAKARAHTKVSGKVTGKVAVKAPVVAVPAPPAVDVKASVKAKTDTAAAASADIKTKVQGAVKASAKVEAPKVEVKPPAVKVEAKAKAGIKLGM